MGDGKTETRDERVQRLKRKFAGLGRLSRLKEYVRYQRALDGQLPHPFPKEYVEDCTQALWEMVNDDYAQEANRLDRLLELASQFASKPFMDDPKP